MLKNYNAPIVEIKVIITEDVLLVSTGEKLIHDSTWFEGGKEI